MWIILIAALQAAVQAAVPPQQISTQLISSDDYPMPAMLLGQEGRVVARLTVAADGLPTECTIVESSGFASLDRATCNAFKARAHFKPALDENGHPTVGNWTQSVQWAIEGNELPLAPWSIRLMAGLDKSGRLTNCAIQAGGALNKRTPMVVECSELSGAIVVPADLSERYTGREAVLIFDQQFVPRPVNSIDTPKDLTRYPLLSRQVVRLTINALGQVAGCVQTKSEGDYNPPTDSCQTMRAHRFTPDLKALVAPFAGTATMAIYVYLNK